jgi:glutamate synthase (NADPH/NADH) large chain
VLPFPVLDNDALSKIVRINREGDLPGYATYVARGLYEVNGGAEALAAKLDELVRGDLGAIAGGARIIVLSDRHSNAEVAPIPSLLFTAAVHHQPGPREVTDPSRPDRRSRRRPRGAPRRAADRLRRGRSVNRTWPSSRWRDLARSGVYTSVEPEKAVTNVVKASARGVLKVMSKMGVSTVASYTGAQIFEALGLSRAVVDRYFTGTTSKLGGVNPGADSPRRCTSATSPRYPSDGNPLAPPDCCRSAGSTSGGGKGSRTCSTPETCFRLQHSTRSGRYDIFKQYTHHIDDQAERLMTLRGLLKFSATGADPDRGGRAGQRDRQAVLHRRDVVRLDQPRGATRPWPSP